MDADGVLLNSYVLTGYSNRTNYSIQHPDNLDIRILSMVILNILRYRKRELQCHHLGHGMAVLRTS